MKNTILIFLFQLLFVFSFKAQELTIGFDYKPGVSKHLVDWNKFSYYRIPFYESCWPICHLFQTQSSTGFANSFELNLNYRFIGNFSIESGVGINNRHQINDVTAFEEVRHSTNHYFFSLPVLGNFHYKNFYLGAGISINSYFISKNEWGWNTDGAFHDSSKNTFLTFISQFGYNYQIREKVALNFGLYYDHLFAGDNIAFRNYGLNLGVRYQIYKNQE